MTGQELRERILESLQWRYAVKRFDPTKKVAQEDFEALEESLRMAPSSYGFQPWKFVVVNDSQMREKLRAVSWNQSQVTDASHYIVLAAQSHLEEKHVDNYMSSISQARGVGLETLDKFKATIIRDMIDGPRGREVDAWAKMQVYIALGFIMEAAAFMKIDACPMEGFEPKAYDELLGLKGSGFQSVAAIALGYRHPECRFQHMKKVRFSKDEVFKYI